MVIYPIRIRRKSYRSRKPIDRLAVDEYNRVVETLEEYVNEQIENQTDEFHVYIYDEIAAALGLDPALVRRVLFSVDYGDDGFMVHKS